MKNEHILQILGEKPFAEIGEAETSLIAKHTADCRACADAYKAAKVNSVLLASQSAFEAPPFFHKRVMANLREKRITVSPFAAFARIWRASRMLVAMMTLVVVCLVGLTLYTKQANDSALSNPPVYENYSTDMVILGERLPSREPTNEQVLRILYSSGGGKKQTEKEK